MYRFALAAAAAMAACVVGPATAQSPNMTPGLWEVSTAMQGADLPPGMGAMTMRQCITADQIAAEDAAAPEGPEMGMAEDCEIVEQSREGSRFTTKMTCEDGAVLITARGEYRGDSYEVATVMESEGEKMVTKVTGKRVGDCP